jgi:hypothetical protein
MRRLVRASLCASLVAVGLGAIVLSSACGTSFDAQSKINGVRILATKIDKPYAKPGDAVNMTMLVADGRADKTVPMVVSWVPAVCTNPKQDLYYACFAPSALGDGGAGGDASAVVTGTGGGASAGDGGADGGGPTGVTTPGALGQIISKIPPHTNLTPLLPQGTSFSFTMPTNIIATHPPTPGAPEPYGLAILFNYACAGHLELVPIDPSGGPQQIPIGCFDDTETPVTVDQGVLGLVRVYSYTTNTNANPVINAIIQDGTAIDPTAGITIDHCTTSRRANCPKIKITPDVPDSSWELNADDKDSDGNPLHEELWVDYYATLGDLGSDARLLYDVKAGKISNPEVEFQAPNDPGEGTMWIVVHDSRSGVEWSVVPVHVK